MREYLIGHIIDGHREMHVCGYEGNSILIQAHSGAPMRKYTLYRNSKGVYFNHKNKRIYLPEA